MKPELYAAIHRIVTIEWDPIGVGDTPEGNDEYNSYIPALYELIQARAPVESIARYLNKVAVDAFGLDDNAERTRLCALQLHQLAQVYERM